MSCRDHRLKILFKQRGVISFHPPPRLHGPRYDTNDAMIFGPSEPYPGGANGSPLISDVRKKLVRMRYWTLN
jgi:hypothetical protein